jgi:uncharacterized membrane protein (UPF0127 family)
MNSGYIYIANNIFPTLLAISEDEQQVGLMGQDWPPPIMTFVYGSPKVNKFWMKNTPSPLDIIFCCAGEISQICVGEPFSTAIIGEDTPSDLVIEVPHGTVVASGIRLGHHVGLVKPGADELKKIIAEKRRGIVKF